MPKILIAVEVNVTDPERLLAYARERYEICWADASWEPENLGDAVLEALVHSNENPDPTDYGLEIIDSRYSMTRED